MANPLTSGKPVSFDVSPEGVAVLRMIDAETKNALSVKMVDALDESLKSIAGRADVKVLILAGLTEYFSSGASRDVLLKLAESQIAPHDLVLPRRLLDIPVPTIAAMEGHAIGGGLALGICCDIVLISRESRYGCTFINYGFTPGMGTTRLLEHVLSPAIAHELLFTGQTFRGSHFEGRGFNYVLSQSAVWRKASDLAARISEKPRSALILLKESLASSRRRIYEDAFSDETRMHRQTFSGADVYKRILEEY